MKNTLIEVIKLVGSRTALAKKCGVRPQQISKWLKRGVPPRRVLLVEKASKGRISRYDLRPDIYPRDSISR